MNGVVEWPACKKCQQGLLIPLSDYGRDGAPITYKAWVCSNPECGFNIRIDNGEISLWGRAPAAVVLAAATAGGAPRAGVEDYRHSGWVSNDHARVVGYAGV